jgi:myo-inositol 2-dehydrogenase / D-chiro-inositol 1-dehydrogenase
MIRIGLIGCGEHAEVGHAISLARYQAAHPHELELAAACDIRGDRAQLFRNKYGFQQSYISAEEMLGKESLQACIAVVPVDQIARFGTKLLESGIPCVIEKPLGATINEIQALRETARRTGTSNMVSVNRRFMPFLNQALAWVNQHGALRYVRATMARVARTESDFLTTTAVHAVDALRYFAGDVESSKIQLLNGSPNASWFAIDLRFKGGVEGRVDVLPTAGVLEETYELFGEGFRAIVTAPFGPKRGLWCYEGNSLASHQSEEGIAEDVLAGFYDETTELVNALREHRRLRPSIADVAPSMELCHALDEKVRESFTSGI